MANELNNPEINPNWKDLLIENKKGQIGFVLEESLCNETGPAAVTGATVFCIQKNLNGDYPKQLILARAVKKAGEEVTPLVKTEDLLKWFKENYPENVRNLKEFVIGKGRLAFYIPSWKTIWPFEKHEGCAKLMAQIDIHERTLAGLRRELSGLKTQLIAKGEIEPIIPIDECERQVKFSGFVGETRANWEYEQSVSVA